MTADSARPSCTRRCIYSGLIAAVDMNVAVALIFTAGGAGQKKDKAAVTSEGTVSPLDTVVDIKDALDGMKPAEEVPATTITTPAATTTTPAATNPRQAFTQVRAVGGRKGGCVCLLVCVCVCVRCAVVLGAVVGLGCFAVPLGKAGPPFPPPIACPSLLSFSLWP